MAFQYNILMNFSDLIIIFLIIYLNSLRFPSTIAQPFMIETRFGSEFFSGKVSESAGTMGFPLNLQILEIKILSTKLNFFKPPNLQMVAQFGKDFRNFQNEINHKYLV